MVCAHCNFLTPNPGLKFQESTYQSICLLLTHSPPHLPPPRKRCFVKLRAVFLRIIIVLFTTAALQFLGKKRDRVPSPISTLSLQYPSDGIITSISCDFPFAVGRGQIQVNCTPEPLLDGIEATYHGLSLVDSGLSRTQLDPFPFFRLHAIFGDGWTCLLFIQILTLKGIHQRGGVC